MTTYSFKYEITFVLDVWSFGFIYSAIIFGESGYFCVYWVYKFKSPVPRWNRKNISHPAVVTCQKLSKETC